MSFIKFYLLITANPLSDSKAALSVFRTIRRLDLLSRDVTIYLPGFHASDGDNVDSEDETASHIAKMEYYNKNNHEDFHGKNPIFHTYCDSVGDMYFNDADFSHFMFDLEEHCPKFEYYGRTELLILPTHKGKIIYDKVANYNLEPFFEISNKMKSTLEEFLMSVLKLLQKDSQRNSLSMLEMLGQLYNSKLQIENRESESDVIVHLDNQILKHMKWKDSDEVFFISYSTKDEFHAFALKALLEKYGKHVWIAPDGIPSGFDYACAIPAALRLTSRFIVLLSHNSASSDWVRKEIGKAISNRTKVDGVFLEGFNIEELKKYDHLDFMFENVQLQYSIEQLFENKQIIETFINQ